MPQIPRGTGSLPGTSIRGSSNGVQSRSCTRGYLELKSGLGMPSKLQITTGNPAPFGVVAWWAAATPLPDGTLDLPVLGTSRDLLDAALASCTLETVLRAVAKKMLPISSLRVTVSHRFEGSMCRMTRAVTFSGQLDSIALYELMSVIEQSPLQKALAGEIDIVTFVQNQGAPPELSQGASA